MQKTINQEFLTSTKNLKLKDFFKKALKVSFLSASCWYSVNELFSSVGIAYGLIGLALIGRLFIIGMKGVIEEQQPILSKKEVFTIPSKEDITLKNSMNSIKKTYKTYKRYSSQVRKYL